MFKSLFFKSTTKVVSITGSSGRIGYSTLFRIASGQMLGPNTRIILNLIDLPMALPLLKGIQMELYDCAFPLLEKVNIFDNQDQGFKDADFALLLGSKPRGPGMERSDLLKQNGQIFVETGKAIANNANRNVKCLVVGNPANTNCLILQSNAQGIPKENFHAMTRLDQNRGLSLIKEQYNCQVTDIDNFYIFGNHSSTMVPFYQNLQIKGQKIQHDDYLKNVFVKQVQQRGAEIIKHMKLSSAASAGNAAIDHIRDWELGSSQIQSKAIHSANNKYGIDENLIFSFPVKCKGNNVEILDRVEINSEFNEMIKKTEKELIEERNEVENLLK